MRLSYPQVVKALVIAERIKRRVNRAGRGSKELETTTELSRAEQDLEELILHLGEAARG